MKVNRAAGPNYLVIDRGEAVGPFASLAKAFAEVLARGGRAHLAWERTVIAGETRPHDFSASFEDQNAGRIYLMSGGMSEGRWQAFPGGHNMETSRVGSGVQVVDTKDDAVAFIETMFTKLMAGRDALSPENAYARAKES